MPVCYLRSYLALFWLSLVDWNARDQVTKKERVIQSSQVKRTPQWIYCSKVECVGSCRFQIHLCILACLMSKISTSSVFLNLFLMSLKKFNPFKDFQSDQIQRSFCKIFTAHYACRNADLNLTLVTGRTNKFIFQIINSLIESWGVRLTCLDCKSSWGLPRLAPSWPLSVSSTEEKFVSNKVFDKTKPFDQEGLCESLHV